MIQPATGPAMSSSVYNIMCTVHHNNLTAVNRLNVKKNRENLLLEKKKGNYPEYHK